MHTSVMTRNGDNNEQCHVGFQLDTFPKNNLSFHAHSWPSLFSRYIAGRAHGF